MTRLCRSCERRMWTLEKLSVRLDFRARDPSRFWSLLELSDPELIQAIGGRRREELRAAHQAWKPRQRREGTSSECVCRHHAAYPRSLREDSLAPHALHVRGGVERLTSMLDEKLVAIVGTRRASDYGMETARELARGLAASGVIVASDLAEGIPIAVHEGSLEAHGTTLTVTAGDLEHCSPSWHAPLYRRLLESGCAISESHPSGRAHGWWRLANARTLALAAQLVIVVEADEQPWELACAHVASSREKHVAAVPGRVSSRASKGTNSLLSSGAKLIRNTQDALDVLYGVGACTEGNSFGRLPTLQPSLASVLERVGNGEDTIEKLLARGDEPQTVAMALTKLELSGWLVRGDGGRYVPSAWASVA